jgi:hypothetical protein
MKYTDTCFASSLTVRKSSWLLGSFRAFVLLVALGLFVFTPGEASGQTTCYAVNGGNWDDSNTWSSVSGGDPGTDPCNDPTGYPNSESFDVEIESGFVTQNVASLEIGNLTVRSTASGLPMIEDMTVKGDLSIESTAAINTYTTDPNGQPENSGLLLVEGSTTNNGTLRIDREDGGSGELVAETTFSNTGTVNIDQLNSSATAPVTVGTVGSGANVTNAGSITMGGGSFTIVDGSLTENTGTIELGGGTLDVAYNLSNDEGSSGSVGGILRTGVGGTVKVGGNLTNRSGGNLDFGESSRVEFTGEAIEDNPAIVSAQALTGDFSDANGNGFIDFTVGPNGVVEPDPDLSVLGGGNPVFIAGELTVASGGVYGRGDASSRTVNEESDMTYRGDVFNAEGDLFVNRVTFSQGLGAGGTTVSGSVFGEVVISNDTDVSIGQNNFSVVGFVDIRTGSSLDVDDKTLSLADDILINGTVSAESGTVRFDGRGRETSRSGPDLDEGADNVQQLSGGSVDFGALEIIGDQAGEGKTVVEFDLSAGPVTVSDQLTVNDADLDSSRPLRLQSDFQIQGSSTVNLEDQPITFTGGSGQSINLAGLQQDLALNLVRLDKSGGFVELNNGTIVILDQLQLDRGELRTNGNAVLESSARVVYGNGTITGEIVARRLLGEGPGTAAGITYMFSVPVGTASEFTSNVWTQGPDGSNVPSDDPTEQNIRIYNEAEAVNQTNFFDGWDALGQLSDLDGPASRGFVMYVFRQNGPSGEEIFPDPVLTARGQPTFDDERVFNLEYSGSSGDPGTAESYEGWNLIGNPYLNNIDWGEVTETGTSGTTGLSSNVNASAYIWDPSTGTYQSGNGTNGEFLIAPFQGFLVQATDGGESVTINIEDVQKASSGNGSDPFFAASGPETDRWMRLGTEIDGVSGYTDFTFRGDGEPGSDKADGYYLSPLQSNDSPKVKVYSLMEDGTALDINNLPFDLQDEVTYPLEMRVEGCSAGDAFEGEAALTMSERRNIPDEWAIIVRDTQTGEEFDLRADEPFTFDLLAETDCSSTQQNMRAELKEGFHTPEVVRHSTQDGSAPTARFTLTLDPDAGPLPVELNNFQGQADEQSAVIEWNTASETNNAGFDVEHKAPNADGFTQVSFVEGAGTTNEPQSYSFRMDELEAGTHTFRLRQSDLDGTTTLSDPIDVEIGLSSAYELATFPNPVRDQATVRFAVQESQPVTIEVYNTLGQRVRTLFQESVPADDTREITLDVNTLSSGLYIVRMRGESFSTTQKVTVVR